MRRKSPVRRWRLLVACVVLLIGASFLVVALMSDGSNGSRVVSTRYHVDYVTLYSPADNGAVEDFWGDPEDACQIVISKQSQTITMCDSKGGIICAYPVSVGRNIGNKQCAGDLKTPEGVFSIEMIHDASDWGHDSNDGNGYVPSCYGNWFMRLKTPPHRGIGIHASIRRPSIGQRASEGCICLHSENLDKLRPLAYEGMPVIIETSIRDMAADGRCEILHEEYVLNNNLMRGLGWFDAMPLVVVMQDNVTHVVEEGDTYLSLAVKYGTTRKNIEVLNPGVDPEALTPGDNIVDKGTFVVPLRYVAPTIYNSRAMVNCTDTLYYTATKVDNFGRIAVMHSTTRDRIIELNPGVNPDRLTEGQVVRVR